MYISTSVTLTLSWKSVSPRARVSCAASRSAASSVMDDEDDDDDSVLSDDDGADAADADDDCVADELEPEDHVET